MIGAIMLDAEDSLVRRAQRGDRSAFEELVRRTSRLVFARLYLETGDTHQAEDLLQETLLSAYRTLDQLEEPGKFRSWLLRIAQNAAIDAARHGSRLKRGPEPKEGTERLRLVPGPSPGPDEQAERDELRQKVLAVLRSLPEEYRLPLTLRYIAGADYQTIEMQMGLTNGALRGLLHRGIQLMRAEMQPFMNDLVPPATTGKGKRESSV
jgi:RNA polymerase sigma-70 factor (ECF subfamily)